MMTELELHEQRSQMWRTDGNPMRTLEDAKSFLDRVGFCLMFPDRSTPLMATWMGAFAGSLEGLPDQKHAFADPRTREASALLVPLLRERAAYEANLNGGANLIMAAPLFPFIYALLGDRNPKAPPKSGTQGITISPLASTVFEALQKHGPLSKSQLRELVTREPSDAALDRALSELWTILKTTRVDYREGPGAFWDVLYRWAPDGVKEGLDISAPEAVSALLGKYLEAVIAATQQEIEDLFSRLTSRSKVREAVHALLAARELSLLAVGNKTLIRLTPVVEMQGKRNQHG
jgi:23S rRNA pseudouridine2605 synthase